MWNYQYNNVYSVYNNYGFNTAGMEHTLQVGYYSDNKGVSNFKKSSPDEFVNENFNKTSNVNNGEINVGDYEQNTAYENLNEINNQNNDSDNSTEVSTKESSYYEEDSNSVNEPSNYNKSNLYQDVNSYNSKNEEIKDNHHQVVYQNIDPNLTVILDEYGQENIINGDISNGLYVYNTFPMGPYEVWNGQNPEDPTLYNMNVTYHWDPNSIGSQYYNGYNEVYVNGYNDMGYNPNGNFPMEPYNMTQDPYTINYMRNVPTTIDLSKTYSLPHGDVLSPNENFTNTSIKYPMKMYNNMNGMEPSPLKVSPNMDPKYNYFNSPMQLKQCYNNMGVQNVHTSGNVVNQMDVMPVIVNENGENLKSIDEETLENIIYSGNIKKIDLACIDFINMSDRIWQALRGAGLFKLGNKGRAILKSKISKHLKMYPELRIRTSQISGVRRATTRQLFQLAQICQITSHLR